MIHKRLLLLFLILLCCSAYSNAQLWSGILDPSRAVDWTQAGFTINEPASQCANQSGSYAPSGGDDAVNINSLIAGCTGGGYILLSAGTFQFSSTGLILHATKGVVIRGAGPDRTKLVMTTPFSCYSGTQYVCIYGSVYGIAGYYNNGTSGSAVWTGDNGVAGSYAKGDTVIDVGTLIGGFSGTCTTVSNCLSVGQVIMIDQDNDSFGFPTSGTGCSESGTTVTCNTTINHNFGIGDTVAVGGTQYPANDDCGEGTNAGYAGYWTVTNVPTSTSFQYTDMNVGLSTCAGGYASKDTGGIYITNITGQTIDQNVTSGGRTCPDAKNPSCQAGEVSMRSQYEVHVITNINGTQLTIAPPIMMNNWRSSQNPGIVWNGSYPSNYAVGDGIENLTVDTSTGAKAYGAIAILNSSRCWLKNMRVISGDTAFLDVALSANTDVLDNYMVGTRNGQSGTYGILDGVGTSGTLVQNNIVQHVPGAILTNGGYGNVWSYNYLIDSAYAQLGVLEANLHSHGMPGMLLWEGNDTTAAQVDIDHGQGTVITAFRNRFVGNDTPVKTNYLNSMVFNAFSRGDNAVGNILGSMGSQTTYAQLTGNSVYANKYVYSIGLADATGTYGGNIPVDLISQSSLLRWGNYDVVTGAVRWCGNSSDPGWSTTCGSTSEIPTTGATFINGNPVPSSTTLPTSFYLSTQPPFWQTPWSTPPWPAIGPDVTGGTAPDGAGGHSYSIPAQLCYANTPIDPAYQSTYTVSTATWSSGTATLTTSTNALAEYETIVVSGVSPGGYDGTYQVSAATSSSVSYALPNNPGSYSSGGTVTTPNIRLFNAANCYPGAYGGGTPAPPSNLTAVSQ